MAAILSKFNGISYMLDSEWVSANTLKLQTDSAAGAALGCGLYFDELLVSFVLARPVVRS